MGPKRPRPAVLAAGALIAIERADRRMIRLLEFAQEVHVPAGALAQPWHNPTRQVRLVRVAFAEDVVIHHLDDFSTRACGQFCAAAAATSDASTGASTSLGAEGHNLEAM
jgi:hypothetical protein